ncbi:MAG: hypothetical protein IJ060_11640 [Oscillospiraceae bacterium]|nr:hypothetical protein [Oscillospiraceae bacterium]
MDSKHDANELDRIADAAELADELSGDTAGVQAERPVHKKKRRPRNPDGTPVRRPRPERPELTAEDVTAEAERLFAGNSDAAAGDGAAEQRPRKKRRPRNPDGTPVRRPRPQNADAAAEDGENPAEWERDIEALQRPRKKRRPRPEIPEEAGSEAESLLNGERDIEALQRPRRKRRPRPETDETPAEPLIPEENAAEEILADAAAEEEAPELDLDWRNDPEYADDEDADEGEKKPSFFARLFGGRKAEDDEEADETGSDEIGGDDGDAEYAEDDAAAYDGGEESDYDEDEDEDEKKHHPLIPAVIAVCAVAIVAVVCCLMYVKNQPKKMIDLINSGDYNAAVEYYQNHSYAESDGIDEAVTKQVDVVLQKYLNEEISYENAIEEMEKLEKLQSMRTRTDFSCCDAVELIHESRIHYNAGREALDQKSYDTAIEEFRKTCEADTKYYEDAQKLIKDAEDGREKVRNDNIQKIISEANAIAQNDLDYLSAYKKVAEAAPLYDNDPRLVNAADTLRDSYIQEKLSSAESLVADNNYDGAIGLLEIAQGEMPDAVEFPVKISEITKAKTDYEYQQHKQQVLAEAAEAFDLNGAEHAIVVLKNATDLANDPDIQAKIKEYESYRSTDITELKVVSKLTEQYINDVEEAKTTKGAELKNVLQFHYIASVEKLRINYENAGYARISFKIAPDEDFTPETGITLTVKVYADDAMVYTSDSIDAESDPIEASAAFTEDTKMISIVVERNGTPVDAYKWKNTNIDIYDMQVAKK